MTIISSVVGEPPAEASLKEHDQSTGVGIQCLRLYRPLAYQPNSFVHDSDAPSRYARRIFDMTPSYTPSGPGAGEGHEMLSFDQYSPRHIISLTHNAHKSGAADGTMSSEYLFVLPLAVTVCR